MIIIIIIIIIIIMKIIKETKEENEKENAVVVVNNFCGNLTRYNDILWEFALCSVLKTINFGKHLYILVYDMSKIKNKIY